MRHWSRWVVAVAVLVSASGPAAVAVHAATTAPSGPRIYWDQNEEEDWLIHPGLQQPKPLVPAWDVNGQMCIAPNGSGHFTIAYNPTTTSQVGNPGVNKPVKLPPIGEAVWDQHGNFTGQTIAVPGPYLGGDIPGNVQSPQDGSFNNNGTYVGCAFDPTGNLFATDIGTAQGQAPPPDDGRLIEWFAAGNYSTYCILDGPIADGDSGTNHHVDGTGGLRQPGTIALDAQGNVLVPVVGDGPVLQGEVLKFSGLPASAASCPGSNANMPLTPVAKTLFANTTANNQPTPQGIARDPVCGCWAVSSVLVGNAVSWYTDAGAPDAARPSVPGNPPPPAGNTQSGYTPQGMAFAPDGTLYFADLHITCTSGGGCGPANNEGQVMKVTFSQPGSVPSTPIAVNTEPLNFPVSVTMCDPTAYPRCPAPSGR